MEQPKKPEETNEIVDYAAPQGSAETEAAPKKKAQSDEFGGPRGEEPTRYGDWERNGRCYDF